MTKHVRQTIVLLAKLRCAADSDRTVRGGDLCRGAPPQLRRPRDRDASILAGRLGFSMELHFLPSSSSVGFGLPCCPRT